MHYSPSKSNKVCLAWKLCSWNGSCVEFCTKPVLSEYASSRSDFYYVLLEISIFSIGILIFNVCLFSVMVLILHCFFF